MKSRGIILGMLCLFSSVLYSQSLGNNVAYFDDRPEELIEVEGFGAFGSNVMDIETMQLFYQGGFFDNDLKGESLKRLGANNLLGAEFGGSISYMNSNVKWLDSAGFYVTYEINGGGGIRFTKDLFRMVFEGNQSYIGDSAYFSGTEFSSYLYKKIGFGYSRDNKLRLGLSLLQFDNYSYGIVNRGIYYSDEAVDSLQFRLDGSWMTDNKALRDTPVGLGVGVDFEVNLPYKFEDTLNQPRLVFGVKNFGLFISSKQMNVLEVDTLYQYSGTELNNISDFQAELFSQASLQDSLLPQLSQDRRVRFLPFEMYFYSTSNPKGKKLQLVYGMRYRFGVAMIPQIYIGGDWRPNESTIITPFFIFGGYSYLKTGLSIRKQIGKLKFGVSFNNVPGFFTKEAYQRSVSMSLSYGIK